MERIKITKPIRLIELFAGVGSQAMALRNIGADFERYLICEWWVQSFTSYKAIHFGEDKKDYSAGMSKEDLVAFLHEKGISADGKEPMREDQIKIKSEKWLRETYNCIKATRNLVNIAKVAGGGFNGKGHRQIHLYPHIFLSVPRFIRCGQNGRHGQRSGHTLRDALGGGEDPRGDG